VPFASGPIGRQVDLLLSLCRPRTGRAPVVLGSAVTVAGSAGLWSKTVPIGAPVYQACRPDATQQLEVLNLTNVHAFTAAYLRTAAAKPEPQLVPERLTMAVCEVTGADGVGLSVFDQDGVPVPIGASCDRTALAERLQFTVGQGPCHETHRTGRPVVATEPVMATRWPAYHDLMVGETLFRSVVALPLAGPLSEMATIDLLFHDPQAAPGVPLQAMNELCRHITAALIEADLFAGSTDPEAPVQGDSGPVWLSNPGSLARHQVMVAAGVLSVHLGVPTGDALKVLKAHAYANHSTTDDTAAALIDGTISPHTFD
jgi:hypothetical protein